MPRFIVICLACAVWVCCGMASAQNTGGVFGPVVNDGHRSAQYRVAYVPADGPRDARWAQRGHIQKSLNDDFMARFVLQGIDRGGPDGQQFQFAQAELFWELSAPQASFWKHGLRLDARIADGRTPDQIGVNWTNQFDLSERLTARAIALSVVQFGDRAADGVLVSARGSLIYDLGGGYSVGLESYNALGSTEDLGPDGRSQQLGPTLNGRFANEWTWSARALFGLNDATEDTDFGIWFGRSF